MPVGNPDLPTLIGESPAFVEMLEHVSLAARMTRPVLVIGERGTGKELVAARLHYLSERWEQRLVRVNCAALTETLLDSELFGHEAGAFTGAARAHSGCFEQADGGTLVLDELGTIPLRMQEKILRVIEYGEFRRVGGSKTLHSDARIVGSTNEHLPGLVAEGRFRADLLDRLAFDVIRVPPLRERPEDILTLAQHFAVNMTAELQRSFFAGFTAEVEAQLLERKWPGNVRELKNAVERSLYRMSEPEVPVDALLFDPFGIDATQEAIPDTAASSEGPANLPVDLRANVRDYEIRLIEAALKAAQFRQTAAAELLGLSYHQLRGLLKKYSLPRSE
ncbi:MAG: phage shock protein operon transcriptional activator [Gammaproteobacteria bacterium]|jgi:psp operon transcriptional activator